MAMMAIESRVMLAAPPWSHAPPRRGVTPECLGHFLPVHELVRGRGDLHEDGIDLGFVDAGVGQGVAAGLHVQRDGVAAGELAELRMPDSRDDVPPAQRVHVISP